MLCNGLDCNRPETFCIYLSFLLAVLFWISKGCRSLFFIFIFIFYFTVFLLWEVEPLVIYCFWLYCHFLLRAWRLFCFLLNINNLIYFLLYLFRVKLLIAHQINPNLTRSLILSRQSKRSQSQSTAGAPAIVTEFPESFWSHPANQNCFSPTYRDNPYTTSSD